MEVFLDYAGRLGLTNSDGGPLVPWRTPEDGFAAFAAMTRGRPCDYSGLSYEKLRGGSGVQWPCTAEQPDGTERLYTDHHFNTDPDYCEDYGHDLLIGTPYERKDRAELDPAGRALLRAAHFTPAHEQPGEEYPLEFTSGRTAYHFHTRTKTGRVRQLAAAAPEAWVELSPGDAGRLGIAEGDLVRVESPRGRLEARARIGRVRDGVVFAPFHYGYWDSGRAGPDGAAPRAANELTITDWDPVSKQPVVKTAAVRVTRLAGAGEVVS
jgi:predicted molibdopterin-dependent oxidoreductase YjgC